MVFRLADDAETMTLLAVVLVYVMQYNEKGMTSSFCVFVLVNDRYKHCVPFFSSFPLSSILVPFLWLRAALAWFDTSTVCLRGSSALLAGLVLSLVSYGVGGSRVEVLPPLCALFLEVLSPPTLHSVERKRIVLQIKLKNVIIVHTVCYGEHVGEKINSMNEQSF